MLPGIDPVFLETEPRPPDDPPYVFHLASGDPRDNTDLVLRAARGMRLVVAGAPEQLRERIASASAELGVDLELTGWVSDERLRELYRGAVALAHPTKYEAYAGLPVLEAMALGTPAVVLDAPGATEAVDGRRHRRPEGGSATAGRGVRAPARRSRAAGGAVRAWTCARGDPDVGGVRGRLRGRVQEGSRPAAVSSRNLTMRSCTCASVYRSATTSPPPRAELRAQLRIGRDAPHRSLERLRVFRWDQQCDVGLEHLADAGHCRGDDGLAERHRLEQRERVTLVARRQHDDVHLPKKLSPRGHHDADVRLPRGSEQRVAVVVGQPGRAEEELGLRTDPARGLHEEVAALLRVEAPE